MEDANNLDEYINEVRRGKKYQSIDSSLVRTIVANEMTKGRRESEIIKEARSKLHQVAAAYQEKGIPYTRYAAEMAALPTDIHDPMVPQFLYQVMAAHNSTMERLPILEQIFAQTFAHLPPLQSILDIACGLNPLAFPWMGVSSSVKYFACDIYTDMVEFLNKYFQHFNLNGQAFLCNLIDTIPSQPVDLAILLKTIPCLEQVDKTIGTRLLQNINARYLLVSFPAQSLGGRRKGMPDFYAAHFAELCSDQPWEIQEWRFDSELVFLVKKSHNGLL